MSDNNVEMILKEQNNFFKSGRTLDINFRISMLRKLYSAIEKYEDKISSALVNDLGKSNFEGFMCEIGLAKTEISYMIKHVKSFSKKQRVRTPLAQFASESYTQASPYGNVLIMSPWNYPFLLTIDPLADAIAAGNTVIIKPSAYSPNTSLVIKNMLEECFDRSYVYVITGGRKENVSLLDKKYDLIFFTGSQNVGKEVMRKAAENLTPTVLELGGKSPCIVDSSAKLRLTAKRIVFGKFLNCGQTCVAPDYIWCHRSVKDQLVKFIIEEIKVQYGSDCSNNNDYGKIINEKHFERIVGLIDSNKVVFGGRYNEDKLQIYPTVLDNVSFDDKVMQEEIFGPLMPILTFDNIDEISDRLANEPKPLALYIFSENKKNIETITSKCSFGGGCVNDTIIHLASTEMAFGGIGESGMGGYHGKSGFEAFSHRKSIVDKKTWMDLPMRYQPYKKFYGKLLRLFLR